MDSPAIVGGIPYTTNDMAGNSSNISTSGGGNSPRRGKKQKNRASRRSGGGDAPAAAGTGNLSQGPAIVGGAGQAVRFRNTEFITDVAVPAVTTTGPVVAINVNASNSGFAGWLSRIATGYELYRFRSLKIVYTPMCSSSSSGLVVMAIDYDATDAPPPNKAAMSAYEGSVRGNVWSKIIMQAKPLSGWYYTNPPGSNTNPSGTDQKLYDIGALYVGVYGAGTVQTVGELSVSYDVEFMKPDYSGVAAVEAIVPTGSALSNLAGTALNTLGATLFTLASTSSGTATLTSRAIGDYLLLIGGGWGGTPTPTNVFTSTPSQTDPSAQTSYPLTWAEYFVAAAGTYLNVLPVSVQVGSVITLSAVGTVAALTITKLRAVPYRKTLP